MRLIQPQVRDLVRVIGQPSFIESYERSSVFPKMNAYIKKWNVDIGDKVKKGDPLATLFVPELVQAHGTKKATVVLDQERITLAPRRWWRCPRPMSRRPRPISKRRKRNSSALRPRSNGGTRRSSGSKLRSSVAWSPQDLLEATNRWKASSRTRDTAAATVLKAEAELRRTCRPFEGPDRRQGRRTDLEVADSEEKRLKAWVDYLAYLPFDGVIVGRNANTFDFVLPTTGDPSADLRRPYLSPSGSAAPIYVVDRIDIVRIFVMFPNRTPTTSISAPRPASWSRRSATSRSLARSHALPGG